MTSKELKDKVDKLEKQLSQANEKISFSNAILESGNLIVWSVDREFDLISFNQNYFIELLPANERKKIYFDQDGEVASESTKSFWKKHYNKAFSGLSVGFEIRIKNNSNYEWKQVFLNPVYNNKVKVIAVSGVAYDITEKTESRRRLANSEEKFRNIFESFQDLYFRTDFKGNIIMLSPSIKEIMGYDEKDLLGKNATNFYIYTIKIKSLLRRLVTNGSVRNFDTGIIHKSGKVIPCICNIRVISHKGKPQYIEGVARDITELRQATKELEESKDLAERSLRIKERFLANMSHEIRTPLNGIMGMLHLIEDDSLNQTNKNRLKILKNSAQILMDVLNDLLDLSKIEAGKMQLKASTISCLKLFQNLQVLFETQALEKKIDLSFDIAKQVPEYIIADEIKLTQIFSNLISNALKFTPKNGSIHVRLSMHKQGDEGSFFLRGSVKDSGIGISEKNQKKIFRSFSQVDSSSSKAYKGTGLGLYISKKLSSLMNGSLEVNSTKNNGAEFWFTFETNHTNKNTTTDNALKNVSLTNTPSIMIVDDNNVNLQIASEILHKAGCKITKAKSGKSAIKKASKKIFNLIFMDIQMPDMDGVDATKLIKKDGLNQSTPIIAMTAYSMQGDKEKFLTYGMDDYISKPIKPHTLLQSVKKWTEGDIILEKKSTPNSSEVKVLNHDILHSLIKYGGKDIVEESVVEFNTECKLQIAECQKLMLSKGYDEILVILHTLKGNSGTLGASEMAVWAERMEKQMKMKKYHIFEENLEQFIAIHQRFKQAFEEFKLN